MRQQQDGLLRHDKHLTTALKGLLPLLGVSAAFAA